VRALVDECLSWIVLRFGSTLEQGFCLVWQYW
jgi:hypothetical protein